MSDHGRLFDQFSASASHTHGGSYFDAGFGMQTLHDAHGKLYDLFGVPREGTQAHGEHFDEFGWKPMPAMHGPLFDTDFKMPSAHDGSGGHGTWFDEFSGGTQVRYMLEGADYEGTVIDVNREFARIRSREGQTHEVGLSQFLAYRSPTQQQVDPGLPASEAESESAHDATAHGGGERKRLSGDLPSQVQHVQPGGSNDTGRGGIPDGLMSTFERLKSLADELDVEKSVDATETAVQGQPTVKTVGHRGNCPRGGSAPCGADVAGHCTLCKAEVRDHEAVGKAGTGDLGITVPERSSQSAANGRKRCCPHCGQELLDHQTAQGQPSRSERQGGESDFNVTHKCIEGSLEVLKTLTEAQA